MNHIYRIDYSSVGGKYIISFYSPITGAFLVMHYIHWVPTEEQANEMLTPWTVVSKLLEEGPTPHFQLYQNYS